MTFYELYFLWLGVAVTEQRKELEMLWCLKANHFSSECVVTLMVEYICMIFKLKYLQFVLRPFMLKREVVCMAKLDEVKKYLRPGQVYRRAEFAKWSNAVDRHLKQLHEDGTLTKLSGGLYYCPKKTAFGEVPAEDEKLVEAFLKDSRFLLTSPNAYNALGVGTTQLYNETVVYNHKRHGCFTLGGRVFDFRLKPHFPKSLSQEFLLVDLVNNLDRLAENQDTVLEHVKDKVASADPRGLSKAVREYGGVKARKFFAHILADDTLRYAH